MLSICHQPSQPLLLPLVPACSSGGARAARPALTLDAGHPGAVGYLSGLAVEPVEMRRVRHLRCVWEIDWTS